MYFLCFMMNKVRLHDELLLEKSCFELKESDRKENGEK